MSTNCSIDFSRVPFSVFRWQHGITLAYKTVMPLIVNGRVATMPRSVQDFTQAFPHIAATAAVFKAQPVREVAAPGLLYIGQREYAIIGPGDRNIQILGSDDATTCHILVLGHTGSGVTALGHFDGIDTLTGICAMVETIKAKSDGQADGRLEADLFGGFKDEREESVKLTKEILGILIRLADDIHLMTLCVTDLNNTVKNGVNFPVIYGIGVDIKTRQLFPAHFPDKGPDLDIRGASHFTGFDKMLNIFDCARGHLQIGPFDWKPWNIVDQWISAPDRFIRQNLSTSPEQEPKGFEDHVRQSLRVILQHPHPQQTLFKSKKCRSYTKQLDGQWIPFPS